MLCHRATAEGIAPEPGKVEALQKLPMPTNVSQLCSLLAALRYYRKFFPMYGCNKDTASCSKRA